MDVRTLTSADTARWDAYVEAHPDATFFHRSGWARVIEDALRRPCHFLFAERNGEIRGVLPLVAVKSWLFGKSLISTGFFVYGGPLADNDEAHEALDEAAWKLATREGIPVLEYRNRRRMRPDWACKDSLYSTFRKDLDKDNDANMKAIPRKQRAMVRKGIKAGLASEIDHEPDRLYRLFSESYRNLGTPVFSRKLFRKIVEIFPPDDWQILTVTHDGTPVSAVMSFFFRDEVLPYFGGGNTAARALAANDFMYWEVMRRAVEERGSRVFDFGRSKNGTGAFNFKKNWGFVPTPLTYEYKLAPGVEMPDVNPLNPKYQLMIKAWQRLPLGVANGLGPMISRSLG